MICTGTVTVRGCRLYGLSRDSSFAIIPSSYEVKGGVARVYSSTGECYTFTSNQVGTDDLNQWMEDNVLPCIDGGGGGGSGGGAGAISSIEEVSPGIYIHRDGAGGEGYINTNADTSYIDDIGGFYADFETVNEVLQALGPLFRMLTAKFVNDDAALTGGLSDGHPYRLKVGNPYGASRDTIRFIEDQ